MCEKDNESKLTKVESMKRKTDYFDMKNNM